MLHVPLIDSSYKAEGRARPYANVGSLKYDKYIDEQEAEMCELMMRVSNWEFARLPREDQIDLLEKAQSLAATIRAKVFRRLVLEYAEKRYSGTRLVGLQITIPAPDGTSLPEIIVRPTWGPPQGELVKRAQEKLRKAPGQGIVVVPIQAAARSLRDTTDGDVAVVTLDQLKAEIDERRKVIWGSSVTQ